MIEQKFSFLSSNMLHDINCVVWKPKQGDIKGIVQISHGMQEHIYRYKHFANFLVKNGFIVCGNDHAGHGDSFSDIRGFMGVSHGDIKLTEDLYNLTLHMKKDYNNIPFYLLGHSMGSFLARMYCYYYADAIDGVIFSGTKGKSLDASFGLALAELMIKIGFGKKPAHVLEFLSAGQYNKKFAPNKTNSDWLSRDLKTCEDYDNDSKCGFPFTYYGYRDLFNMLLFVSSDEWYKNYPKNLPTLLVSGTDDPVGDFGKGVKSVYSNLKRNNVKDLEIKLFNDARHEILNETNKREVYYYLMSWLEKHI